MFVGPPLKYKHGGFIKHRKYIKGGYTFRKPKIRSENVIVHRNEFVLPRGVPPTHGQINAVKRRGGLWQKNKQ